MIALQQAFPPQNSLIPDKTTNPGDYNLMALLLGEPTPWGMIGKSHEYSLEQSGMSVMKAGVPAGPLITGDGAKRFWRRSCFVAAYNPIAGPSTQ